MTQLPAPAFGGSCQETLFLPWKWFSQGLLNVHTHWVGTIVAHVSHTAGRQLSSLSCLWHCFHLYSEKPLPLLHFFLSPRHYYSSKERSVFWRRGKKYGREPVLVFYQ